MSISIKNMTPEKPVKKFKDIKAGTAFQKYYKIDDVVNWFYIKTNDEMYHNAIRIGEDGALLAQFGENTHVIELEVDIKTKEI